MKTFVGIIFILAVLLSIACCPSKTPACEPTATPEPDPEPTATVEPDPEPSQTGTVTPDPATTVPTMPPNPTLAPTRMSAALLLPVSGSARSDGRMLVVLGVMALAGLILILVILRRR